MVKRFLIIIILLLFSGCCYNGTVTEYGYARIMLKSYPKIGENTNVFEFIDTLSVYEKVYDIYLGNKQKHNPDRAKVFLRFYKNGKISSFNSIDYDKKKFKSNSDYIINRTDFNPLKSHMGYLYQQKNKLYINHHIVSECRIVEYLSEIIVKQDTIIQMPIHDNIKHVYVKRNFPKEFLEGWIPDW